MGKHLSRRLRLVIALSSLVVLLASASVAYAGARWTGIDPELSVEGHQVNILVAVPPGQWCNIDGPIDFTVGVPELDNAKVVYESEETFKHGRKSCTVTTNTTLREHNRGDNMIFVGGEVEARRGARSFPVDVVVSVDGVEQTVCTGFANRPIRCAPVYLNGGE